MTQVLRYIRTFVSSSIVSLVFVLLFLSGCASTPAPSAVSVEGTISASNVLNPDLKGGYRPVNIKVFYLKSAEGFAEASFTDLYKYPDKALGGNILDLQTQQILPGQNLTLKGEIPPGLRYIGVIAAYRNLDEATWKDIKPVPEKCFTCTGLGLWDPVSIKLERLSVSIDTGAETSFPKQSENKNNKADTQSNDDSSEEQTENENSGDARW